jgi:ferredoxin-like protein FixX
MNITTPTQPYKQETKLANNFSRSEKKRKKTNIKKVSMQKAKNLKTCHDRCPASVYPNRCHACFGISKEKII